MKIKLIGKINVLFEDWTPCPAALLWQGALRSSKSNIDFYMALNWEENQAWSRARHWAEPGMGHGAYWCRVSLIGIVLV